MDPKIAKALREPFPPEQIGKLPRAGTQLDFVGHAATLSRILEVYPDATWTPMGFDEHGIPILTNVGLSPQTKMGLWITMTIDGVTRPGFGDGNTIKECLSDAIRNAAMRFGVAIDLWSKEDLHGSGAADAGDTPAAGARSEATTRAPAPATNGEVRLASDAQRRRLFAIAGEHGVERDRLKEILMEVTGQDSSAAIPAPMYDAVVQAVELEGVPFS